MKMMWSKNYSVVLLVVHEGIQILYLCTSIWVYYVPIESQRQPNVVNPFRVDNWVDLENLQHRTESIVNKRLPHRSQLFSVRVYDPGQ